MDLFKFTPPMSLDQTELKDGQILNGWSSVMWIERYLEAGEFEIVAPVDSMLREIIPLGTMISHMDTSEIMIVESHEIDDTPEKDEVNVKITGRSLETILENRIVGQNYDWTTPPPTPLTEYVLGGNHIWLQVKQLLEDHISFCIDDNDELPWFSVVTTVPGISVIIARSIPFGDVYSAAIDLLRTENLGIKIVRPEDTDIFTKIVIHSGVDRSETVSFSHALGDIESSQYLWSLKAKKTSALVLSRWLSVMVHGPEVHLNRRVMLLDASDLDQTLLVAPTGGARTAIENKMIIRGEEALASQNEIAISRADISQTVRRFQYRKDYDVGDIVTVYGNYGAVSPMRVIEYVEINDENGEAGYPTLGEINL